MSEEPLNDIQPETSPGLPPPTLPDIPAAKVLAYIPPMEQAPPVKADRPGGIHLLIAVPILWAFEVVVALVAFGGRKPEVTGDGPLVIFVSTLVMAALTLGVCWYFLCAHFKRPLRDGFDLHFPTPGAIGLGALVGVIGAVVVLILMAIAGPGDSFMEQLVSTPMGLAVVSVMALIAPFYEEVYYRQLIFPVLRRLINPTAAILLTGVWFLTPHLAQISGNWAGIPAILLMGLGWSWLRHRTGSLVPCVLSHFIYNGILVGVSIAGKLLEG
jgi:hypothetical protein